LLPWQLLVIEPVTSAQQVGIVVGVRIGVVGIVVEVVVGGKVGVDVGVGWVRASCTILAVWPRVTSLLGWK
jgi:hypothetical protein